MKNFFMILRLIETAPLPVFVLSASMIDQSITQNWQEPLVLSSITALFTTTLLLANRVPLNWVIMGMNIYFVIGSFALLTRHAWLIQAYTTLEASGLFIGVLLVGTITLLWSPTGFIGISSEDRKSVVLFSLYLLLATLAAFLVSFNFQGNKIFSEYIPFIGLFAARSFLRSKMTQFMQGSPSTS